MIACEEKNGCEYDDTQDICELGLSERKEMGYHWTYCQDEYVYHHIIAMRLDKYQEQRVNSYHYQTVINLTHTNRIPIAGGHEMGTPNHHHQYEKTEICGLRHVEYREIEERCDVKNRTQVI